MRFRFLSVACAALALNACKSEPKKETPATATASVAPPPSASASSVEATPPSTPGDSSGVTRLTAPAKPGDEFGYAVAAGTDRLAVSAWKRGGSEDAHPGSIFVYKKDGAKFSVETELSDEKAHQIGNTIALEGNVLAAGAMFDDGATKEAGAAYVFSHEDSGWSKAQKLVAPGGKKDDSFGIGLAIAGDSIAVSNTREAGGSLFMFERDKTDFKLKQTLPFPEQGGPAEAVSAYRDVIAIGAQYSGKAEAGVAHVYSKHDKSFKEDSKVAEGSPGENQHFGGGIAVGPGLIAIASEKQVSVFANKDGKWTDTGQLVPPDVTGLADGGLAVGEHVIAVGLPLIEEGRVLIYREKDGAWKLDRTLTAPDGKKDDWFGYALSINGKLLLVGAPLKDDRGGAAYTVEL